MNNINQKRSNRTKKKELKLPPHSNESYPLTYHGAANKPLVTAMVSIAVIIIFIILLFVGKQLVGKAFYAGDVNTAGFADIGSVEPGDVFAAVVQANIGTGETVAISFTVSLPSGISCDNVIVDSLLGWDESDVVLNTAQCENNLITFEYATLDWSEAETGDFDIAEISFPNGLEAGTYRLDFDLFTILDLNYVTRNFITEGIDADLIIAEGVMEQTPPECSAVTRESCTRDQCISQIGVWVLIANTGKCVQCSVDTDCQSGQSCQSNRCVTPSACTNTAMADAALNLCTTEILCEATAGGYWGGTACLSCGNGRVDAQYDEECDDTNLNYVFTRSEVDQCNNACQFTTCSDGIIQSPNGEGIYEICDDGNKIAGDGCSFVESDAADSCLVEAGFSCAGEPSTCTPVSTATVCTPTAEICDQQDNNCDGQIDENACLTLTSPEFSTGSIFPEEFTCGPAADRTGISPPLIVSNIPSGTRSLSLVLVDMDVNRNPNINPEIPAVHWAVLNIPVAAGTTILQIPSSSTGAVPGGTLTINEVSAADSHRYAGPCPPLGETHRYRVVVYAFNDTISPGLRVSGLQVNDDNGIVRLSLLDDHVNLIQQASLTTFYYPPPAPSLPPSGGGGGCIRQWSCPPQWSYCNATLEQSRMCTDLNRCDQRKLTKLENRSCAACDESWICTAWNNCQNSQQTRNCVDEHACRTIAQKPALQKSCTQAVEPLPAPARIVDTLVPLLQEPLPSVPALTFWQKYQAFLMIALAGIILLAGIVSALLLLKPKPVSYNLDELKEWVQKEQQMGTSNNDIKDILAQHTGWNKEDIEKVCGEVKEVQKSSV